MKSDFYPFNITVASTDDKPCRSSFLAACEKDSVSGFFLGKHIVFRSLIPSISTDIKHHIFGYSASVYGVEVISRMPSYRKSYCFRFSRIFSVDKLSFQGRYVDPLCSTCGRNRHRVSIYEEDILKCDYACFLRNSHFIPAFSMGCGNDNASFLSCILYRCQYVFR